MATVLTDQQPAGGVSMAPAPRTAAAVDMPACLVVSGDPRRAVRFEREAGESGWNTLLCHDAGSAADVARRQMFQLVIIDLQSVDGLEREQCKLLAEQFSAAGTVLQMICGNEGDCLEEIWARQIGVWLYLPGVDDACDVALLCGEAMKIMEKRYPALRPQPMLRVFTG